MSDAGVRQRTVATLDARQAERRLVLLTATRWLPVGVVFGVTVLLPLERGLSLAQVGVLLSIQGFVVLGFELPTGGLADTVGRRPVLIASGIIAVFSTVLMLLAQSFWMFVIALALQGVFRALDSGPLEAWFVDSANAADARHPIERGLSRASMMLGIAIAVGALASGALIAWHPFVAWSALALPFAIATALYALHTLLLGLLLREAPRQSLERTNGPETERPAKLRPVTDAGVTIVQGLGLLRSSPVLRALVLVEVFWSAAMVAFETFTPVQLADMLGGEEAAAALFGPASAAAWALFAAGAWLAGIASRRIGVAWTAAGSRILNGLFVIGMGIIAGPVGLIAGYWLAYLTHGAAGPMHNTLLHREATSGNRAVILSINSMITGGCYSLGLLVLAPLADATTPAVAFIAAGAFSVIGAFLYIPAIVRERACVTVSGSSVITRAP